MKKQLFILVVLSIALLSCKNNDVVTVKLTPSFIPTDGLVAWYPFNGNASDESGNGNNGTVNGASLATDRFGATNSSYNFNGSSNILIPYSSSFNYPNYTVSLWVSTSNTSIQAIIKQVTFKDATNERFVFGLNTGYLNEVRFSVKYNSTTAGVGWQPNIFKINILDGKFHHLVGTVNGSTTKLYIDGTLVNTLVTAYSQSTITNGGDIQIGRDWSTHPYYFTGIIDDVGFWNRALTPDEITALYNAK